MFKVLFLKSQQLCLYCLAVSLGSLIGPERYQGGYNRITWKPGLCVLNFISQKRMGPPVRDHSYSLDSGIPSITADDVWMLLLIMEP